MADFLRDKLGLTIKDKSDAGSIIGKVKGIADFFADAAEAIKKAPVVEAIKEATPWWVPEVAGAAADILPPFKFVMGVLDKLTTEHDPLALGLLACTTAYQKSVESAIIWAGAPAKAKKVGQDLKEQIASFEPEKDVNFDGFAFHQSFQHPFIKNADQVFDRYLDGVGYSKDQKRQILAFVHRNFVSQLKALLSNGKLRKRFEPFTELMKLDTVEKRAYDTILSHIDYQRWQFEESPIFGKEPYALKDVYIGVECGVLRWEEIDQGAKQRQSQVQNKEQTEPFDPFLERCGGRCDLLKKVEELIGDSTFKSDAIIIQGAAGSGKSSFTLKLCTHLAKLGLYPVRIRLRDMPLDVPIDEAIPKALFPPDHELPPFMRERGIEDPFAAGIFNESVDFGNTKIRPFILILDGWDEISLSANEGFKVRVSKMLEQVRNTYLKASGAHIRVILTGRPSAEVGNSNFLKPSTPVLTIRPILPSLLREFVACMRTSLELRPVEVLDEGGSPPDMWTMPPDEELETVFQKYEADFTQHRGDSKNSHTGAPNSEAIASLAVLGLPLLAHLAFRLIARWDGDRAELIGDPTTLYRSLVDLTCVKRGQPAESSVELSNRHPKGTDLRILLQRVAAAMTAHGEESISYRELELRLSADNLNERVTNLLKDHDLAALMIAFFFKGGHDALGCEFLHKSFREYLFAECIVQALKDYRGKDTHRTSLERKYWKDFEDDDDLFGFSRALGELLSPQWLSLEVVAHLERLLPWEIARSSAKLPSDQLVDKSTATSALPPLSLEQWENIRDGLADLWLWWSEGIHMRPQIERKRTGRPNILQAYVHELVELDLPRDDTSKQRTLQPARATTMDAHLGDGLFRLNAIVHFQIATLRGWLKPAENGMKRRPFDFWSGVDDPGQRVQSYQSLIEQGSKTFVVFAPSGNDGHYFDHFASRINAAGWRRGGRFPVGIDMRGLDLRGIHLCCRAGHVSVPSNWSYSNLSGADLEGSALSNNNFSNVLGHRVRFSQCYLREAKFSDADLKECDFYYAFLQKALFINANLDGAKTSGAFVEQVNLNGAMFSEESWHGGVSENQINQKIRRLPQRKQSAT